MDGEAVDFARDVVVDGVDAGDFRGVADGAAEVASAPAHVILVLSPCRQEGAEVDELLQPALGEEVVEEGEGRRGVARRSEVFEEGNLHVRALQLHAGVPRELGLLLEEEDGGGGGGGRVREVV